MKPLMPWNDCIKAHIKEVEPDKQKISSIVKMCLVRMRVVDRIELDAETASVIAEDYYEIIKELLTALLLKEGLKSDNHECLIRFAMQGNTCKLRVMLEAHTKQCLKSSQMSLAYT
ncbi:MAG: hypothetical protein QME12_09245 [Nanoarchaeota archaeon]|nr:hypothetical protein [Nanoarchaeota archaeon]